MEDTSIIIAVALWLIWALWFTYKLVVNSNRIKDLQKTAFNTRIAMKELTESNNLISRVSSKLETTLVKHTGQIKALNVKNFSDKESIAKRKDCNKDRILSNKTTQNT